MKNTTCSVIITKMIEGVNHLLMVHPTGNKTWDIPKGIADPDEPHILAAKRELQEETGFIVNETDLVDLGIFKYRPEKDMHVFQYKGNSLFECSNGVCISTFTCHYTKTQKPEVDAFKYVPITDVPLICNKSFLKIFEDIKDKL